MRPDLVLHMYTIPKLDGKPIKGRGYTFLGDKADKYLGCEHASCQNALNKY